MTNLTRFCSSLFSIVALAAMLSLMAPPGAAQSVGLVPVKTTLTVSGDVEVGSLTGIATVTWQIVGTWTGNVIYQGSVDNGVTWIPMGMSPPVTAGSSRVISMQANGAGWMSVAGFTKVRAHIVLNTGSIDVWYRRSAYPAPF